MKLVLTLEIIFIFLQYASSTKCTFPYGLHVSELGLVYTVSCSDPKSGFHFSRQIRNFLTFKRFYRAICEEDGQIKFMSEKIDDVVFCADESCDVPDSDTFFTTFNQHLNNSIITSSNLSEIYYCVQNEWYSLFETSLPQDLVDINNKEENETALPVHVSRAPIKRMDSESFRKKLLKIDELSKSHDIRFLKQHKVQHKPVDSDLCGIAIIIGVICSFLFFIIFILIISSRISQKNQIRQRFLEPSSVSSNMKKHLEGHEDFICVDNGTTGKSEISHTGKPRENLSGKAEYVFPNRNLDTCKLVVEH